MATDALKAELKKYFDKDPIDVKMITPKNGHAGESRIYVLYFKKSDGVKTSTLRANVTGLFSLRVKFEYYSPKKLGPTQCSRCLDYSHGAESCRKSPMCIRCGENHPSASCKYLVTSSDKGAKPQIPKEKVKCANCSKPHPANYSKCEYRLKIMEKQQMLRQPMPANPIPLDDEHFPHLRIPDSGDFDYATPKWGPQPIATKAPDIHALFAMQQQMLEAIQDMMKEQREMFKMMVNLMEKIMCNNNGK